MGLTCEGTLLTHFNFEEEPPMGEVQFQNRQFDFT
jgi:hypothetical protein